MDKTKGGDARSDPAEQSCSVCKQPDNEEMVQCDVCDMWFHFECVGVGADIADKDWMCAKCSSSSTSNANGTLGVCEDNAGDNETFLSPMNTNEGDKNKVGMGYSNKSPSVVAESSTKNRKNLEMRLQRLEAERKMNMLFIERKYEIMCSINESDDGGGKNDCRRNLSYTERKNDNEFVSNEGVRNVGAVLGVGESNFNECTGGNINRSVIGHRNENVFQPHTLLPNQGATQRPSDAFLRQDQVYSRQVIPRELPVFSGKPEEWPLFISSYENSTRLCGFSNDENLLRLQRALRGKALEHVSSRLTLPALVPEVISTLRMLFGRPENIIHNLLTKLRAGPSVNANKLETLVHFSLDVKNIVVTMEAADLNAHLCNPMLLQEFIERLPAQMRLDWAVHSRKLNEINLIEFSSWLFNLADAASSVINILPPNSSANDNEKRKASRVNLHEERNNLDGNKKRFSEPKCFGCDETGHFIARCEQFRKLDYNGKWNIVREKKLCRSCLKVHDPRFCRDRKVCAVNNCTAKHHHLLHKPEIISDDNNTNSSFVAVHRMMTSNVLFRFVPITIHGEHTSVNEYALLDEASGPTLIEKSVLEELNIHGEQSEFCMRWTDESIRTENKSDRVNLKISPLGDNETQFLLTNVRSVSKLDLPKQTMIFSELAEKYKFLRGLPVKSYENIVPKIIIGLRNKHVAMPLKYKEGTEDEPAALKTRLGWTIYGTNGSDEAGSVNVHHDKGLQLHICECDNDTALHKLVKQNFQLEHEHEGVETHKPSIPIDTKIQNFVERTGDKLTAKLLWKSDNLTLPDNYEMAFRRLICFERKLEKDNDLKIRVNDHINNMLSKGYIRKLSEAENNTQYPRKWFLPIFVVRNPNKPDKVRLVWDAAAEHHGVSLNSNLEKGPDLLTPLINVLFNFRIGKIGISGDISEMFHRVAVDQEDTQSQRFLWRNCNNKIKPDVYILQVMSFGASCSPSLAQYVKNNNAKEFEQQFPRAVKSITERHYVDDILDSVDTIEEAIQLAQQVRDIHKHGNFHIRNWMSNSKEVVTAMGAREEPTAFCTAGKKIEQIIEPEKVLGMWWRTSDDVFTYNLKFTKATKEILSGQRLPTKRELLRLLMSIFDPLGLLSFYTVHMKILLQNVWRKEIAWDEIISDEFSEEWLRWLSVLKSVESVNVPRCYFKSSSGKESQVQMHVFVDASENAYGAVAYFRIQTQDRIETSLVASKTKVAPLRPVSIPRMELLAAVLAARLAAIIKNGHELQIESTYFWTDSKTVLLWLKSDPRRYKQFVMFRVAEIQEITDISNWRYVPSKTNVADLTTKWVRQPSFKSTGSWFTGPPFLCQSPNDWPKPDIENKSCSVEVDIPEGQHVAVQVEHTPAVIDYTRFSTYERLLRSMAYVKRFIEYKTFSKSTSNKSDLTSEQLHWSQKYLVKLIQSHTYTKEIRLLEQNPSCVLPKSSELRKLSPFLDGDMILRLRGRLENATIITDEAKNPILLPRNHYITHLLVDWYHRKYKHVHHETVINEIFQKFHIPGLRTLLRTVRKNCTVCKIRCSQPNPPEMGPLPEARMSAFSRPFSHVGLDFFDPFLVTVGRRSEKRYGAVFTCLTIRAVHIEVVYSLDMNSCVMAIRNFIARRGVPLHMYSDNGTNLKAAEKELRTAYQNIDFQSLKNEFTTPNINWTFIPPASPHMGGAWERMVRSIKTVLYQIITPDHKLNDERLHNLFLEVESIINSRPLTYLSLESADQEALTPNHFLLGTSSGNKPPGEFDDSDMYLRRSWRHSQVLTDKFWKRWVAEVLPTMTRRTKWFDKVKPIEVGDIVIIIDSNLPRYCWPKGIVMETIIAKDGQVRSAVVRTVSGVYHRPAAKIAVLDIKHKK